MELSPIIKRVRQIVVFVIGGTVLLIGIALIVLPGPAFVVIPAGLAILALEFSWAKRWLDKARAMATAAREKAAARFTRHQQDDSSQP